MVINVKLLAYGNKKVLTHLRKVLTHYSYITKLYWDSLVSKISLMWFKLIINDFSNEIITTLTHHLRKISNDNQSSSKT